jgi:hypothetical protein
MTPRATEVEPETLRSFYCSGLLNYYSKTTIEFLERENMCNIERSNLDHEKE